MKFKLQKIRSMPRELEPGILYVSNEYGTAAHLCACGCGAKIRTPLGPTEWSIDETPSGPTLWPSVGNWQQACKSHYVIYRGNVQWAGQWSEAQILAGRKAEQSRRAKYYEQKGKTNERLSQKILKWLGKFLG